MIGKPFGRARRRETSAFSKATVLSENSIAFQNAASLLWKPGVRPRERYSFIHPSGNIPDNRNPFPIKDYFAISS